VLHSWLRPFLSQQRRRARACESWASSWYSPPFICQATPGSIRCFSAAGARRWHWAPR